MIPTVAMFAKVNGTWRFEGFYNPLIMHTTLQAIRTTVEMENGWGSFRAIDVDNGMLYPV